MEDFPRRIEFQIQLVLVDISSLKLAVLVKVFHVLLFDLPLLGDPGVQELHLTLLLLGGHNIVGAAQVHAWNFLFQVVLVHQDADIARRFTENVYFPQRKDVLSHFVLAVLGVADGEVDDLRGGRRKLLACDVEPLDTG